MVWIARLGPDNIDIVSVRRESERVVGRRRGCNNLHLAAADLLHPDAPQGQSVFRTAGLTLGIDHKFSVRRERSGSHSAGASDLSHLDLFEGFGLWQETIAERPTNRNECEKRESGPQRAPRQLADRSGRYCRADPA